jgi:hypothetical protein
LHLLFSRNDDPLHAHHRAGDWLAPTPPTDAGKPLAVGTRLEVTSADGTVRAVEIHAGSGYLSMTPTWLPTTTQHIRRRERDGSWHELALPSK